MQQDKAALDALFVAGVEACQSRMFRVARVMLRSDADAEDAVSSAIVSAYAHLPSLRRPEALPGYLIRCVVNACHAQTKAGACGGGFISPFPCVLPGNASVDVSGQAAGMAAAAADAALRRKPVAGGNGP